MLNLRGQIEAHELCHVVNQGVGIFACRLLVALGDAFGNVLVQQRTAFEIQRFLMVLVPDRRASPWMALRHALLLGSLF